MGSGIESHEIKMKDGLKFNKGIRYSDAMSLMGIKINLDSYENINDDNVAEIILNQLEYFSIGIGQIYNTTYDCVFLKPWLLKALIEKNNMKVKKLNNCIFIPILWEWFSDQYICMHYFSEYNIMFNKKVSKLNIIQK